MTEVILLQFRKERFRAEKAVKDKLSNQRNNNRRRPNHRPKHRKNASRRHIKKANLYLSEKRKAHIKTLKDDFADKAELNAFVDKHTERMQTNAIKRKVRLMRKLGLQRWDYFATFTYSDDCV